MSARNSLKPIVIGGIVAALVIGAFILGRTDPFDSEGPAEQLGEKVDEAAQEMKEGVEKLEEGAGQSGN